MPYAPIPPVFVTPAAIDRFAAALAAADAPMGHPGADAALDELKTNPDATASAEQALTAHDE